MKISLAIEEKLLLKYLFVQGIIPEDPFFLPVCIESTMTARCESSV